MADDRDILRWGSVGPVLLVGHRGAGKSTLGRRVAHRLSRPFVDLDEAIAGRFGDTPADLIDSDLDEFRRRELQTLRKCCQHDPAPIIACGGGVDTIPPNALTLWLDRADWRREVRESDRPRIRPDIDETEEWNWMERTRTPRWRRAAHLRLTIPRGRSVDDSARQLATLLRWTAAASHSTLTQKTWLVPAAPGDLERASIDVQRLGFAGIELRSDVFSTPPKLPGSSPCIASLRHDDPQWLDGAGGATWWDIDAELTSAVASANLAHRPSRLIVSAHPDQVAHRQIDELQRSAARLATTLDIATDDMVLKYAPEISDFDELGRFIELTKRLRATEYATTILTPTRRFAWIRPIFARRNNTAYLPVGLRDRQPGHPCPVDFQTMLPHLAGPAPRQFDALVGNPVDHSRGDMWHRRAALNDGERHRGYLKTPASRGELDNALEVLDALPIRGISVTSPLKREAAGSDLVANCEQLPALNTLLRTPGADHDWSGTDTDQLGMARTLEYIEARGIGPGDAVVFGRGGASHAVLRALDSRRWNLVEHISARQGWRREHRDLSPVDLIVNAAGPDATDGKNTPTCRAWLDLHYTDVDPRPDNPLHIQGDLFFVAQARAQRQFWNGTPLSPSN